jgi:UDP:flavonoid glycosyltransferase YjiC (YdhE family)
VFLSAYDPPAVGQAPWLAPLLSKLGPVAARMVYGAARTLMSRRARPLFEFRRSLGLAETPKHPLFEGQFSESGTLALYSRQMGAVQPDYPPDTVITGFAFHDRTPRQRSDLAAGLQKFLSDGPPPLVFTLGSLAVDFAGDFFRVSAAVARSLGRRAVLLVGSRGLTRLDTERSTDLFVGDYAPYSELLPHAQAVVHHGGIGTVGQALRAGIPQLVIPFHTDQFDNAARVVKLGVARSMALKHYAPDRVAAELSKLLANPGYRTRAASVGQAVAREDGGEVAARTVDTVVRITA